MFPTDRQAYREYETMDIYAKRGTPVVYMGVNGYSSDVKHCDTVLIVGKVYTVDSTEVSSSSTSITLKEFPNKWFNSVCFCNALV